MEKNKAVQAKGRKRQSFLYGALILTGGMAAVKVIGALFKVPLKYSIGEYGMGLFNVAYNFYGPVFSLATAGFPIAVSRMVSENGSLGRWRDVRQIKRAALPMFLGFGVVGMIAMTLIAPFYCTQVMGNSNALYPMLALAPAILCASVSSVYRGYYEGLRNMTPTAVSEIIEALVKLGVGLGAAGWVATAATDEYKALGTVFGMAVNSSDEAVFLTLALAAAGAVLGVTAGSVASLAYLLLRHKIKGEDITREMLAASPPSRDKKSTAGRLLKIAVPVAVGSVAMNVAGLIDATFLQSRIGYIVSTAPERLMAAYRGMIPPIYMENPDSLPTFLYGCYTLALTVYLLVPAITQAFGISALPAITEAWIRGNKRELASRMDSVLRITAMFCFPAGLGISALALPVTEVLYGADSAGPIIAGVLGLLGIASLTAAMSTPLSSMLQAAGRADLPVKLLLGAMAIKIAATWALCSIPEVNLLGAGIGTLLCYSFFAGAQFISLSRITGVRLSCSHLFFRPLACAILCAISARTVYNLLFCVLGRTWAVAASICCGAFVYVTGLLILRSISKNDVLMLPKGQKIAKMLEKRGWI